MKKVIWTGANTLEYVENAEFPDQRLGDKTVLIRVTAVGLCSTDVHIIQGNARFKDPPMVLGHEVAGVIEKAGAEVTRVAAGDRVTVDSMVGCGECRYCLRGSPQFCVRGYEIGITADGGMQEFLQLPERNVIPIPDQVSDEEAAILDPEVLGSLRKPGVEKNSTLLVIGPGPGGLIAVQLGKILGAGKVLLIGTRRERLLVGKRLGADIILDSSSESLTDAVLEATDGCGPDMVFEAAGTPASLSLALDLVSAHGKVVLYGIRGSPVPSLDVDLITLKDMTVYGAVPDKVGWEDMFQWIIDGSFNLREIITHRFSFKDTIKAYEVIRDRRGGAIKAVLFP